MSMQGWLAMRSLTKDDSVKDRRACARDRPPGARLRAAVRREIVVFLVLVVVDAALVVATPAAAQELIDDGVTRATGQCVIELSLVVAALAVVDARADARGAVVLQRASARASSTTCAPRSSPTCCASPSPSSPAPRPAPW